MVRRQAQENSMGASKLRSDRLAQEKLLEERHASVAAEEQQQAEARSALQEREGTLRDREQKAREREKGGDALATEGRRLKDRLSLREKDLEEEKRELAERKVMSSTQCTPRFTVMSHVEGR